MRSLIDVTTWIPARSGIGLYTERLLRAWADQYPDDEFLFASNLVKDDAALPGRQVTRVGPVMPSRALWMQTALPLQVGRLRPDVAFYPNYLAPIVNVGAVPRVVTVHDMAVFLHPQTFTWKKRVLQRRLLPALLTTVQGIITPSESTRRDLLRLIPNIDPRRVASVALAADPACHLPVSDEQVRQVQRRYDLPQRYLLAVGTLEPRKNLVRLIEAFELVWPNAKDVKLILVGGKGWRDGAIADALKHSSAREGIDALGYVSFDDLRALYRGATAMCYPSLYEGFGLPVIEAMACGAPVLTSHGSSLDEVAAGAALQIDPLDVQAIASGLQTLLLDNDERNRLAEAGQRRAGQLSWQQTASTTRQILQRVAEGELPNP
ncbi:MAG: hypothetical protein CMH53_01480 [Myxococcales bacterium]|nr:hypothetical protein [Myxococcales bacterium]